MSAVSEQFVSFIKDTFFVEPRYIIQQNYGDDWNYNRKTITEFQIQDHFNGDYYIGFASKETAVNFLVFDLDCHKIKSKENLKQRVDLIKDVLDYPNIISRSPGNGLHIYYFFDKQYTPQQIRNIIKEYIPLKKGSIELFPSGTGLRLFGGNNCPLLNNITLYPVVSNPSQIEEYFTQAWEYSDRLDLKKLITINTKTSVPVPYKFKSELKRLVNEGLQEENTRNESLLKLNWALQTYNGFSPEEAKNYMIDWIATKHNDKSKDWQRDPQYVTRHISEMAQRYDPSKIRQHKRFAIEKLSFEIILFIKNIAEDISEHSDLETHKIEEFLQCLVAYALENHTDGLVEIPSSVFKACKNGSRARYIKYKSELINHGVITLVKNYSTASNKCATYKIKSDLLK